MEGTLTEVVVEVNFGCGGNKRSSGWNWQDLIRSSRYGTRVGGKPKAQKYFSVDENDAVIRMTRLSFFTAAVATYLPTTNFHPAHKL